METTDSYPYAWDIEETVAIIIIINCCSLPVILKFLSENLYTKTYVSCGLELDNEW